MTSSRSRPDPASWKLRKLLRRLKYREADDLAERSGIPDVEEERELIRRCQQKGDKAAMQRLMEAHSGLIRLHVWRSSRRYFRRNLKMALRDNWKDHPRYEALWDDLMQEGYLGFIRAVNMFDFSYDNKLMTYAQHWIQHYVVAHCIRNVVHGLTGNGMRRAIKGIPFPKIVRTTLLTPSHIHSGYYESFDAGQQCLLADLAEKVLRQAFFALNDREFDIWYRRWFGHYVMGETPEQITLQTLGDEYGITRERVRQIEEIAFAKLRSAMKKSGMIEGDVPPRWCQSGGSGGRARLSEDDQHLRVYMRQFPMGSRVASSMDGILRPAAPGVNEWIQMIEEKG